tara:strand:+ start:304 stop:1281 length:978 start_codon:yes stop_codon:yes gene_type:complete
LKKIDILKKLDQGVVLGDGGYIVELEQRGYVVTGAFTPEIALTHPSAVKELHTEMKLAGCDVLQVMAFYGSREKLNTVGYGDKVFEINSAATNIAKEVAGDDLLVAGDLSTTWMWNKKIPNTDKLVSDMFDEQIKAQSGVDFIIGELFFNLGEALICLDRIQKISSVPSMITMSFRQNNISEDGYSVSDCAKELNKSGCNIIGLNCMNDPKHMYPLIKEMRSNFNGYLAAQPVAYKCTDEIPWFTGQPGFPDKLEPYHLNRYELGQFATKAKEMGVNYIGGCCGCKATHMREMAKALGKYKEKNNWIKTSSAMSETEYNKSDYIQ